MNNFFGVPLQKRSKPLILNFGASCRRFLVRVLIVRLRLQMFGSKAWSSLKQPLRSGNSSIVLSGDCFWSLNIQKRKDRWTLTLYIFRSFVLALKNTKHLSTSRHNMLSASLNMKNINWFSSWLNSFWICSACSTSKITLRFVSEEIEETNC